jgi:hypothetical protein
MGFVKLLPRKFVSDKNSKSKVNIRFVQRRNENFYLSIRIGKDIANKIGIKPGDKVSFSYESENNRIWLIEKASDRNGYTLGGKPDAASFILNITWYLFAPTKDKQKLRHVKSDIYEGGIRIFEDVTEQNPIDEPQEQEDSLEEEENKDAR